MVGRKNDPIWKGFKKYQRGKGFRAVYKNSGKDMQSVVPDIKKHAGTQFSGETIASPEWLDEKLRSILNSSETKKFPRYLRALENHLRALQNYVSDQTLAK